VSYKKNPSEFDDLYWALIRKVVPSGLQRRRDLRFWTEDRKGLELLFQNTFLFRDCKNGSNISFQHLHFRLPATERKYCASNNERNDSVREK
jgi:hypothetical protein